MALADLNYLVLFLKEELLFIIYYLDLYACLSSPFWELMVTNSSIVPFIGLSELCTEHLALVVVGFLFC